MGLVVLKIGGAAITDKNKFETLRVDLLIRTVEQLVIARKENKLIIVHGAGSFGHFQAKEYEITKGNVFHLQAENQEIERRLRGVSLTHESVKKLSSIVTDSLLKAGIPAISCPLFQSWETETKDGLISVKRHNIDLLTRILEEGFIPVLHGDIVIDEKQGFAVLSGDIVVEVITKILKPVRVVFLTDVAGIYDRPPQEEGAKLMREIEIQDGKIAAFPRTTIGYSNDSTGGILTKIKSATVIANFGIDVFIVEVGTKSALQAINGEPIEQGTKISKKM